MKNFVRFIFENKEEAALALAMVFGGSYIVVHKYASSEKEKLSVEKPSYIEPPLTKAGHSDEKFPFQLLQLSKSENRKARHRAVKSMTMFPNLDDSQYTMIAQACDFRTAVGLARTFDTTHRFFLRPPALHLQPQNVFSMNFILFMYTLPSDVSDQCVKYFTEFAKAHLRLHYLKVDPGDRNDDITGDMYFYVRQLSSSPNIKLCLQAILAHSTIPEHRHLMVKNGLLKCLHDVRLYYNTPLVQSIIGRVIGNIALEETLHSYIFQAGWVGVLATWMKSPHIHVYLPAAKALLNLDRDYETSLLEDGMYQLYPLYREKESKIGADVVFIHGIMGGAFKTWRQHDTQKPDDKAKNTTSPSTVSPKDNGNSEYTFCWPKDWLAKDFPDLRLIAVDYTSHVTEWKIECPYDKKRRTLKVRAEDTLEKLKALGLGERPIVWVSHSMGGLIVKQILVDAKNSQDNRVQSIAKSTTGVIFYSVPHLGSRVNGLNGIAEMLLQLSIEIKQLKKGSPELLKLHDEFKSFVEKQNIKVLSFGETVKSHLGLWWNSVLVPKDTANPGFGEFYELEIDHLNTCKPKTKDSESYKRLVTFLQHILPKKEEAPQFLVDKTQDIT